MTTAMSDDARITINVNVEELHLHYPSVESDVPVDVEVGGFAGADEPDSEPEPEPEPEREANHTPPETEPRPGGYDIRDKPATGLALLTIADSEGVTPTAISDIHDLKLSTASNAVRTLYKHGALDVEKRGNKNFYTITDFGERVLETYRERWRQGNRNLPEGFWEGIPGRTERNAA